MRTSIRARWRHYKPILGDVAIHYVSAGEGPLVVLLHGFPDFWYSWIHQLAALSAAGFRAVAVDLRGYNVSDKPRGVASYRIDRVAADITALIRHLGASKASIVGHDWGAVIGWHLAGAGSDLVEKAVMLSVPHPSSVVRELWRPSQALRLWYQLFFQIPRLPEWLLLRNDCALLAKVVKRSSVSPNAFTGEDLIRYRRAWSREGVMTASLNYYRALARSWSRAAGPSRVPSLLVYGEKEIVFLRRTFEGSRADSQALRIERIAGAGHFVHLDQPAVVNELIIDFLGGPRTAG